MTRPLMTSAGPGDRTSASLAYTAALLEAARSLDSAKPGDRRAYREFQAEMRRAREALGLDRRRN